jgi:putative transposase
VSSMHRKGRRTTRLAGYDYTQPGAYFVTICAYKNCRIIGEIDNQEITSSDEGQIVSNELRRTELLRPEIQLDRFVIMPNHIHMIIIISEGSIGPSKAGAQRDAPLHRPA